MMPPYYESRFIRANHPDRAQAIWLRWTLLLPVPGDAVADVWVMLFDPDGAGNRALKVPHPVTAADYLSDPWSARIADTVIDDAHARGTVDGASWDLTIAPGDEPAVKLLTDRAYAAKFPTAKTQVRHPLARFDGNRCTGRHPRRGRGVDGQRQPQLGQQAHPGLRLRPGVRIRRRAGLQPRSRHRARAAVGPLRLPAATLFVLRHAGWGGRRALGAGGPAHSRGPTSRSAGHSAGRADGFELRGEIRADPRDVIGLTYTDTNGKTKYCYNSALADCRITVSGNGLDAELTASRRAMFEILTDERLGSVPVLL